MKNEIINFLKLKIKLEKPSKEILHGKTREIKLLTPHEWETTNHAAPYGGKEQRQAGSILK